jgi:hypothetical protein
MSQIIFKKNGIDIAWFDADDPNDKDMVDPNEIVLTESIYITNDEKDGLYYLVTVHKGMTRRQLALKLNHWLIIRNVYYNIKYFSENNKDIIEDFPLNDYASNLVIHSLKPTGRKRKGLNIYYIDLSS